MGSGISSGAAEPVVDLDTFVSQMETMRAQKKQAKPAGADGCVHMA